MIRKLSLFLMILLALALVACGGGTTDTTNTADTTTQDTTTTTTTEETTADTGATPRIQLPPVAEVLQLVDQTGRHSAEYELDLFELTILTLTEDRVRRLIGLQATDLSGVGQ